MAFGLFTKNLLAVLPNVNQISSIRSEGHEIGLPHSYPANIMILHKSLDAELLRFTDNSDSDGILRSALLRLAEDPNNKPAIDYLLRVIQAYVYPFCRAKISQKILDNPDYPEILNKTYCWMLNTDKETGLPRILGFEAWEASSTKEALANWMYGKSLSKRLKDLYYIKPDRDPKLFRNGKGYDTCRFQRIGGEFDEANVLVVPNIASAEPSTFDTVAYQAFFQDIEQYLIHDPEDKMKECKARNPNCNAHSLVHFMLQGNKRPSMREIEQDLGLTKDTADYQWNRNFLPLLTNVFIEIATRHGIELDLTDRFPENSKKRKSTSKDQP